MKLSSSGLKRTFWFGLFIAGILAMPFSTLRADEVKAPAEEKPTGDFTVAAMSQYVWRGYELSRNSVVIQPSMTIGYKGFSVKDGIELCGHRIVDATHTPVSQFFSWHFSPHEDDGQVQGRR